MSIAGKPSRSTSGIYPSKKLGQHFLRDSGTVNRIVEAVGPRPDETLIEIGPGTGALTAALVEKRARVVAIEFDDKLIPLLRDRFAAEKNFKLVQADALSVDFCKEIRPATAARLVANLPYNISTAILQRLLVEKCITQMVLMLQREVVDRMLAIPGSRDRGFLSVLVEAYCHSEKLFDVSPGCFRPPPKVWSSVVRLDRRSNPLPEVKDAELFWDLVSASFAQKRKTMFNNLRAATGRLGQVIKLNGGASIVLCRANVALQRRAETLELQEWEKLVSVLA